MDGSELFGLDGISIGSETGTNGGRSRSFWEGGESYIILLLLLHAIQSHTVVSSESLSDIFITPPGNGYSFITAGGFSCE